MSKSQRRIDPTKELAHLEARHKRLKAQVAEFESRVTLSSQEQIDLQTLKKKKLATKDAIHRMTQL